MKILLLYLVLVNLAGIMAVLIDKRRARHDEWRVRERTLFFLALVGGTPGVYLSMRVCHHKTKHKRFMWGLPLIFLLQLAAVGAAGYYWYTCFGFPVN